MMFMNAKKELKPKKCKSCGVMFKPFSSLAKVCSMSCSLDFVDSQKAVKAKKAVKEFDKTTRAMKMAANDVDKAFWQKKAQAKFNEFIRERDKNKPCISCHTTKPVKYDAGHYVPRGRSAALAFNEFNCHKQCSNYCNVNMSGNLIAYRSALIEIYGAEKVEWLESNHEMPKYRVDDYKRIYAEYETKLKELKS